MKEAREPEAGIEHRAQMHPAGASSRAPSRRATVEVTAVFLLALAFFALLFHHLPVLYDTDSYYHLAIARAYHRHGIVDQLPWAKLSLLHDFGDKELLFHLLLAPLADTDDPTAGGRWALALLNAAVAAALAGLGRAAVGRWGLIAPLLVYGGSLDFLGRMIRLRPEILSLLLLLAAVWCASRGRYRWLGVVAALYALAYTAFHAFLGLAVGWFLFRGWARRQWRWELLLYPLLGLGVGLLAHPHFPQNLVVWKVQSVDFFQHKATLDVGAEIRAHTVPDLLFLNLPWVLGLLALWAAARPRTRRDDPAADLHLVTAAAFGLLFLLMLRFSTYAVPFATLALLYHLRRRDAEIRPTLPLPWRGKVPTALAVAAALALGVPRAGALLGDLAGARGAVPREAEWHAFGRQVPAGARVAADWGTTHVYMFWAPQAIYLNVLDPVFMAVPYPDAHRTLRAVLESRHPDVPHALAAELRSDHLALSRFHQPQDLLLRLAGDPRTRLRYRGYTLLYELVPGLNRRFLLDWRVIPEGTRLPPDPGQIPTFEPYPRAADPDLRALEGYVDATRVDPDGCVAMVHPIDATEPTRRLYHLAPYGPTQLWLDDRLLLATADTPGAHLARATTVPVHLDPGRHHLTVLTCPGDDGEGRAGFYLVDRSGAGAVQEQLPGG